MPQSGFRMLRQMDRPLVNKGRGFSVKCWLEEKVRVSNEWQAAFWGIVILAFCMPLGGFFHIVVDMWRPRRPNLKNIF